MPASDAPLFEYQIHPPKRQHRRGDQVFWIASGPPLTLRFMADRSLEIRSGEGGNGAVQRFSGPRAAEMLEAAADFLRGETVANVDRIRTTLIRLAAANREVEDDPQKGHEAYADLEVR